MSNNQKEKVVTSEQLSNKAEVIRKASFIITWLILMYMAPKFSIFICFCLAGASYIVSLLIYNFFVIFIFDVKGAVAKELAEKAAAVGLSLDDFAQVYFKPRRIYASSDETHIAALEKECKFYARFDEYDDILLIATKNDSVVFEKMFKTVKALHVFGECFEFKGN